MYQPFLLDWLKVFPRENIYVTRLEDYAEDKEKVLTDLYKFLDISKCATCSLKFNHKCHSVSYYAHVLH